jgi:hypothetical protein
MAPKTTARQRMLELHSHDFSQDAARETMQSEGFKKSLLSKMFKLWPKADGDSDFESASSVKLSPNFEGDAPVDAGYYAVVHFQQHGNAKHNTINTNSLGV